MNWENLKKNINRAGTSILQKTGFVERTVDADFEAKKERLKSVSSDIEELHKEAKAYLDAMRSVTLTQGRLSSGMSSLLSDSDRLARQYRDINEELGDKGRKEFDESFRVAVMEPVARFGILFPECEGMIKSRNAKLLDYDAARAKVKKSTDKPSGDVEKLPRLESEEQRATEAYEELNDLLIDGIPKLIDARQSNLEPSMLASLKLQALWAEESSRQVNQINLAKIPSDRETESAIREIRQLPILNM